MRSVAASRRRLQWFFSDHPRGAWALVVILVLLVSYPFWAGALAAKVVGSQLSARLGVPVTVRRGLGGLGNINLYGLKVGEDRPLLEVEKLQVPSAALWGGGTVVVQSPRVEIHHGGPRDNVGTVLARLKGKGTTPAA